MQPGDLFVAMPGTVHDGHRFVDGAFAAGAAGAIVSQPVERPARARRGHVCRAPGARPRFARAQQSATIFGVTGSVGKTSTKEALYAALDRNRPGKVHRSVKSYNNHTGVPLSLARMPRDAEFAVLEMGMNNAGEIAALTRAGATACGADHRDRARRTSKTSARKRRSPTPRRKSSRA